jgi:DNA ligase 4
MQQPSQTISQPNYSDDHSPSKDYPEPPKNRDSPPFGVLAKLFDKLSNERKQERRRRILATWFEVSLMDRFCEHCSDRHNRSELA